MSGQFFTLDCLVGISRNACDIRESEDRSEYLSGTTHILCLGERAMKEHIPGAQDYLIQQVRGYVFDTGDGIKRMCSFLPIDCYDIVDWESTHNSALAGKAQHFEKDDEDESDFDIKRKGKTRRSNYRFWLETDTRKLCRILTSGMRKNQDFEWLIYPPLETAIHELTSRKGELLYIDLETDLAYNINTIGFNFSNSNKLLVVPILRYSYEPAYRNLHRFFQALVIAFRDNIPVAWNGKGFDFWLLAWRYKIMIPRYAIDPMLSQARCYPEAEKSLGHGISMWIDQWRYHKDDGVFMPHNNEQEQALWNYNGADVLALRFCHERQTEHAEGIPGLTNSIRQINNSIRPYLLMELTGMHYKKEKLAAMLLHNDKLMMQYLRCMKFMHGPSVEPLISNQKCVRYFNDLLGYPVVARTKTGASQMDEKALLALQLKYPENSIIAFVIAFRALKKESGSLKFFPMWERMGVLPTKEQLKQHKEKYGNEE